jgi:hypothetical protein
MKVAITRRRYDLLARNRYGFGSSFSPFARSRICAFLFNKFSRNSAAWRSLRAASRISPRLLVTGDGLEEFGGWSVI